MLLLFYGLFVAASLGLDSHLQIFILLLCVRATSGLDSVLHRHLIGTLRVTCTQSDMPWNLVLPLVIFHLKRLDPVIFPLFCCLGPCWSLLQKTRSHFNSVKPSDASSGAKRQTLCRWRGCGGTAFLGAVSTPSHHRAGGTVYVKIRPKHFEVCGVFVWLVLSKLM